MKIGEKIKKIRAAFGLSQAALADRIDASRGEIANLEYNLLSNPERKISIFRRIEKEFGVPVGWILSDDDTDVPIQELDEREQEIERIGQILQSNDPLVKGFLSWYGQRTDAERKEIRRYVLDFAEKIKEAQGEMQVLQKNTAAARSGDRVEAAQPDEEAEEANLPPIYTGDI